MLTRTKILLRLNMLSLGLVMLLAGCAAGTRQSEADANPMLQKQGDDHALHGEVGAFYGRSVR